MLIVKETGLGEICVSAYLKARSKAYFFSDEENGTQRFHKTCLRLQNKQGQQPHFKLRYNSAPKPIREKTDSGETLITKFLKQIVRNRTDSIRTQYCTRSMTETPCSRQNKASTPVRHCQSHFQVLVSHGHKNFLVLPHVWLAPQRSRSRLIALCLLLTKYVTIVYSHQLPERQQVHYPLLSSGQMIQYGRPKVQHDICISTPKGDAPQEGRSLQHTCHTLYFSMNPLYHIYPGISNQKY